MRLNAAAMCWPSTALVVAFVLGSFGCSGSDGIPVGGPFGGSVPPGALDVGEVSDSGGVLDPASTSDGGILSDSSQAPTWTQLFNAYFAVGKVGNCAHSGCHQAYMTSPSAAFSWLRSQGQVGGSKPTLADPNSSCLSWLGGDMPLGGPQANPAAVMDFDLWVKAGAQNN